MQEQTFGRYLNELEALNNEIGKCPDFDTKAQISQDDMLRRFDLNRTLVNLLHYTTVHMVRNRSNDYDAESARWISSAIASTSIKAKRALESETAESIRALAARTVDLTHEILTNIEQAEAAA